MDFLFMFMFICHIANREAPLKGEVSNFFEILGVKNPKFGKKIPIL